MDFVISRVCMAMMALLVVGVLSGLWSHDPVYDPQAELDGVVMDLCSAVDSLARSDSACSLLWDVPWLSSSHEVIVSILHGVVQCSSGGLNSLAQSAADIRTWSWDGSSLNSTELEMLDDCSGQVSGRSGEALHLSAAVVFVDGSSRTLLFVSRVV